MKSFNLVLVGMMLAATATYATARNIENPEDDLISASSGFVDNLKGLQKTLDKRPAKVEIQKWSSIRAGAVELKTKAARLREMIATADRSGDKLGIENGNVQARLKTLAANFQRRAKEAEDQSRELSEPLASVVLREKNVWLDWAKTTELFGDNYSNLLAEYQIHVAQLKPLDSVLKRLEEGANDCAEVAGVGEKLENAGKLETFVDEINSILDAFNVLSDQTKGLISKAESSTNSIAHQGPAVVSRSDRDSVSAFRKWTSINGKSFVGRLVSVNGDNVRIKNQKDGKLYDVPLKNLAVQDRKTLSKIQSSKPMGLAIN